MEVKVKRQILEDGRYMSEITIPEHLWPYGSTLRQLTPGLQGAGFPFDDPCAELRIRRPCITLIFPKRFIGFVLSELEASTTNVERVLEWITNKKIELNPLSFLPIEWQEGEFSIPIPPLQVPA